MEGALFQQPQLAAALSTVPTLMPASWYDTLEVRVHTLTLLATAASAGSLDLPTPGATGSILEDIDAIWKTSGSAPGVGASDGGCVDAMRSVHLHLHMLASGDSHTTDGIKPLFQPKGPVVCSFKLIRLRVAPLGDTLRISLMQRSGLHLRSQVRTPRGTARLGTFFRGHPAPLPHAGILLSICSPSHKHEARTRTYARAHTRKCTQARGHTRRARLAHSGSRFDRVADIC